MVRYILDESSYPRYERQDGWTHYHVPEPNCSRCRTPFPKRFTPTSVCKFCHDDAERANEYPEKVVTGSVYLSKAMKDRAQMQTPLGKQSLEILQLKEEGAHADLYSDVIIHAMTIEGMKIDVTNGILVPIPQKRKRKKISGPYALSLALSKQTGTGVKNLLTFIRPVKSQIGLNADQRKVNMVDTMKCFYPISPVQTVYLVDDTITTGSTIIEAVRAVQEAGAECVIGLMAGRATSMTNLIYSGMVSKNEE